MNIPIGKGTARVAKKAGAIVYERFDNTKKTKGYALDWFLQQKIQENADYDAVCIFDADNIVDKNFIKNMNKNNIQIWDDIYPCEFFEDDINNKRLYVMADDEEIISAFALCDNNAGEAYVEWSEKSAKAMYIDRLGVNVEYSKKGIGQQMLNKAKEISKSIGAEYLRLFVVDINKPAIRLYQKNGFTKVDGVYDEVFDDGYVLREIGYEIKL